MLRFNKKAQNTLEYAVLIAVVAGALIAMQTYMKRAFQGNLQSSADDMGEQFSISGLYNMTYNYTSGSNTTETFSAGETKSKLNAPDESTRWFEVNLKNFTEESWNATSD